MILSIDPGSDKSGIAIYDPENGAVILHQVILTEGFSECLAKFLSSYPIDYFLLGDGTFSKRFSEQLKKLAPEYPIMLIDEAYSTLEARNLYFQLYPPCGWRRIIPVSMQTPEKPFDDLVAVVLLKRYLGEMPKICR